MITHPHTNRAFTLSLSSMGLFFCSIGSFVAFFRTTEVYFLFAILGFMVFAIVTSIVSIVYAGRAKKQFRLNPNDFNGKEKNSASIAISIVSLVLNILFVFVAVSLLYFVANIFK